ncbi:MAG: 1-phosphofructokinase [Oscillospiraceae bacterium]|nr:1-phosphofructokinase [Oscillospiraceae bacterium]
MIYTVTFNPSLDYIVRLNELELGHVNRTQSEEMYPGGKGVNVSVMLKNLGLESVALGFIAGFTGDALDWLVKSYGCRADFIRMEEGATRINVKIKAGEETDINGQGPVITQRAMRHFYSRIAALKDGDTLVLAGSIPSALSSDVYEDILQRLQGRDVRVIVDATGDLLKKVLSYRPFLIKPNSYELAELFGKKNCETAEEILFYAKQLQQQGARNVLVSRAGDGAVLLSEDGRHFESLPPAGKVVNSVGAGDSMVAGFIAGYMESGDYAHAFQLGLCAGSASAFHEWLATREQILELMQ